MDLKESIFKLYQDTGEKILPLMPDKLRIICEEHIYTRTGNFSISLEIIVIARIQEHNDFGLVFSTTAQKKSHYGTTGDLLTEGYYLITDLGTSDGRILDESDELIYLPSNNENIKQIWGIIEEFTLSRIDAIKPILLDRYPELTDK